MSELPRRIVSRLRRFVGNRRRSKRVRANLSFTLSLSDPRISSNGHRRLPSLDGHTLDVSVTGLALLVPAIRIGGHYLAGDDRKLHIRLELPSGAVEMMVATVRYETSEDDAGYLIGARILEMSAADRASFDKYIAKLMTP
jgi:c-di-GMP-binding flagellar brake protein YcgR